MSNFATSSITNVRPLMRIILCMTRVTDGHVTTTSYRSLFVIHHVRLTLRLIFIVLSKLVTGLQSATEILPLTRRRRCCIFFRAMLCISEAYAVTRRLSVCLSVCPSRSWIVSNRVIVSSNFLPSGSQAILVFPHQTSSQYPTGTPPP